MTREEWLATRNIAAEMCALLVRHDPGFDDCAEQRRVLKQHRAIAGSSRSVRALWLQADRQTVDYYERLHAQADEGG